MEERYGSGWPQEGTPPPRPALPDAGTFVDTSSRALPPPFAVPASPAPGYGDPRRPSESGYLTHAPSAPSSSYAYPTAPYGDRRGEEASSSSSRYPGNQVPRAAGPPPLEYPPTSLETLSAAAAQASRVEGPPSEYEGVVVTTVGSLLDNVIPASAPPAAQDAPAVSAGDIYGKGKAPATTPLAAPTKRPLSPETHLRNADSAEDFRAKRQRSLRACDNCRSKKIRCIPVAGEPAEPSDNPAPTGAGASSTKLHPCSNCVRSGSECTFSRVPLKRGPNKGFIQALEDRIKTLESSISTDGDATLPTLRNSHLTSTSRAATSSADTATLSSPAPSHTKVRGLAQAAGKRSSSGSYPTRLEPSPHDHAAVVYATAWQSCFCILPSRYRSDGFRHPALRSAAQLLVEGAADPAPHGGEGTEGEKAEAFWRAVADAAGAAVVGVAVRRVRTAAHVRADEEDEAETRRRSREKSGGGGLGASSGKHQEAQSKEEGEQDPQKRLEQEVAEDEFSALILLYCAAAKGGRLIGTLLSSAWAKLGLLEGKVKERAEWVHFQLDLWHSFGTHQPISARFLPLRRDLPHGRALLTIADDSPTAGLLLSTAMLGGLAARASEAAGWTEIREHEVSLTFGWQWSDGNPSGGGGGRERERFGSRSVAAKDTPPPAASSSSAPKVDGVGAPDGASQRDHVQAVFALFAKLYHRVQGLPRLNSATLSTVEDVLDDVAKLVEATDSPEKLAGCEVVAAHVLGLATMSLAWCAATAFALPRDQVAFDLMTEAISHLGALARLCQVCAARDGCSMPVYFGQIAQYAEVFSKTPKEPADVVRATVLELGCLGSL